MPLLEQQLGSASEGLRAPRRSRRSPRGGGDPGVAAERRVDRALVPGVFRATLPGRWQPTPPANAAATFTHVQAGRAAGDGVVDAVPATAAAVLTSAGYAARFERSEGDREIRQRHADGRADDDRAGLGQHRRVRQRNGHALLVDLEQRGPRHRRGNAACRWSRRRGCSC